MGLLISPDTPYGKEMWKWDHMEHERHPSDPNIHGMRPSSFRAYPAMLYQATQKNPWQFERKEVADEVAERLAIGQGFVSGGQGEAARVFDERQQGLALAAAERNFADRHMGEKARDESSAAEQASSTHLGEIPRTPIRKGWPKGKPRKPKAI